MTFLKRAAIIAALGGFFIGQADAQSFPGRGHSGSILGVPGASQASFIETTISAILDRVIGSTQGGILFRGASAWKTIAVGTSNTYLKSQGAGADLTWAAAAGGGNVTGPGSSVAGHVATYSDTTGANIQDGGLGFPANANTSGASRACGSVLVGELCKVDTTPGNNTATFSNGSANIVWATATPTVGEVVTFQTTGGLPTGFGTTTNYYVVSQVGTTIQVSATAGGSAITAASAGTGTQTGSPGPIVSSAVAIDIAYVSLGIGDWHCEGAGNYIPNSGVTAVSLFVWLSATSNVLPPAGTQGMAFLQVAFPATSAQQLSPSVDFYAAAPTKYFLSMEVSNTGGARFVGGLTCRRTS